MFVVTVILEVERDAVAEFMARVQRQANDSLTLEPGCHRFDIAACTQRPEQILLYEIYDDAEAFAVHLASDHFAAFDKEVSRNVRSKKMESWSLI